MKLHHLLFVLYLLFIFSFFPALNAGSSLADGFSAQIAFAQTRPPTTLEKIATQKRERASAYVERIARSLFALASYDEALLLRIDIAIREKELRGEDTYRSAAFATSAHGELAEGTALLASSTTIFKPPFTNEALLLAKAVLDRLQERIEAAHNHIGEAINAL